MQQYHLKHYAMTGLSAAKSSQILFHFLYRSGREKSALSSWHCVRRLIQSNQYPSLRFVFTHMGKHRRFTLGEVGQHAFENDVLPVGDNPSRALRILVNRALDELHILGGRVEIVSADDSGFVHGELEQHLAGFSAGGSCLAAAKRQPVRCRLTGWFAGLSDGYGRFKVLAGGGDLPTVKAD